MNPVFKLTILPLDEHTASLVNIEQSENDAKSIFILTGKYEGYNYYYSPKEIRIYTGYDVDGKEYKITKIGRFAFSHCRDIVTIVIGPYVNEIEWNMYKCKSLLNILVDKDNKDFHDIDGILFKGNELVGFPQGRSGHYDVPNGTLKIGNMAFKSCALSSIHFPNTLEVIGINAFYECRKIKEFVLPSSIKKVELNHNRNNEDIEQVFYLYNDVEKRNPLNIAEIVERFRG